MQLSTNISNLLGFRKTHPEFTKTLKRLLHSNTKPTTEKVLLVSNSGAFALHWSLFKSPKASQHRECINELRVFYRQPWFCDIHPDHDENKWGQSPIEFPQYVREIFRREVSASHDERTPITFRQNRELHEHVLAKLRGIIPAEQFVDVKNDIKPVKKTSKGFEIEVDGKIHKIAENAIFFNWLKTPEKHTWSLALQDSDTANLYKLPKNFFANNAPVGRLIILGASPIIPWVFRDFSGIEKVFMIKREDDKIPKIPRNGIKFEREYTQLGKLVPFFIDGREITTSNKETCKLQNIDPAGAIMLIEHYRGKDKIIVEGHFFKGIGHVLEPITNEVDQDHKVEWRKKSSRYWVAPKNIPSGSLTGSYQDWMRQTKQTNEFYEIQTYFNDDQAFRGALSQRFHPKDSILHKFVNDEFNPTIDDSIRKFHTCLPDNKFHKYFEKTFHDGFKRYLSEHIRNYTKV